MTDTSTLLGVKPGERRALVPALLVAFLAVGALGLSTIACDTLFVSTFTLGEVSRFYVVGAAIRVGAAFAYAALTRRLTARAVDPDRAGARVDAQILAATGLIMVASGLLAGARPSPALVYAVCALQLVLSPLLPLIAFNAVLSCFHARQAKRLLPLVAASATVGSISVSAGASLLAATIGTPGLLALGGLLAAAAVPLPTRLGAIAAETADRKDGDAASAAPAAREEGFLSIVRDTARDVRVVPVVRVVVLFAFLGAALGNFTDFAFKAALKADYGRDDIATAMGFFGVAANVTILLAQLFLASRVVGRFGIRASMAASPVLLVLLAPTLLFAPGVAAATAVRFAEMVGRYSFGNSCADVLLTPTERDVRTRAKVVVKGASSPLGYFASGVALSAFGVDGPSTRSLAVMIVLSAVLAILSMRGVRRAYTAALAKAIGRGRLALDVSADGAAMLRGELGRTLAKHVAAGDRRATVRTLDVMSDRFFTLADLSPALRVADVEMREAALATALRLARPGEGAELLSLAAADEDPALEQRVLATARKLGATIPEERIDAALARVERAGDDDEDGVALWAEALIARVERARAAADRKTIDASVKELRKAALGGDSRRRAAALFALGELNERRAEREVLRAMGSHDPEVFLQAATAAVKIDASGAIPSLVMRLTAGPHVRAASRALSLAGPVAINELVSALPTTRGEGAIAPTAVATEHGVSGTIRAARVLARIGPDACERVLSRFAELGYRARDAVAKAFATMRVSGARSVNESLALDAMGVILSYAERLMDAWPFVGLGRDGRSGLLSREISHRLSETSERVLDLASVVRDRSLIARARSALAGGTRDRAHALELLENLLPSALAQRTVAVLEHEAAGIGETSAVSRPSAPAPSDVEGGPAFDGWLKKCRQFDRGELPLGDPMLGVLEKVLVLREASLFTGLSGEELYPVAEIASSADFEPGEVVVKQGDPGDALYVVAHGALDVLKDGNKVTTITAGNVFGEMALLDGAPRAATVQATTEASLLRIPRAEFEGLLDESPELARGVIRTLLGHLRGR